MASYKKAFRYASAIAGLKPRFITFSLKNNAFNKVNNQIGLLLPMDESRIREAIKSVSIPLHEGVKYATNTSYTIAGLGVNFSLLPYRLSDTNVTYGISVCDIHSKAFETDARFDGIRQFFAGTPVTSIYDNDEQGKKNVSLLCTIKRHNCACASLLKNLCWVQAILARDNVNMRNENKRR